MKGLAVPEVWKSWFQDEETSKVIGANSYNTLMEKLVALQASTDPHGSRAVDALEESTVDFAAATTATLGVPTPSASQLWSSETSFEELTNEMNQEEVTESAKDRQRKGDSEEARQLLQVRTAGGSVVSSIICLYGHCVGTL